MLVRSTPNSIVTWVSSGVEPMSVEELAAIPLTPAAHDDPRWVEIAYESGDYERRRLTASDRAAERSCTLIRALDVAPSPP